MSVFSSWFLLISSKWSVSCISFSLARSLMEQNDPNQVTKTMQGINGNMKHSTIWLQVYNVVLQRIKMIIRNKRKLFMGTQHMLWIFENIFHLVLEIFYLVIIITKRFLIQIQVRIRSFYLYGHKIILIEPLQFIMTKTQILGM